jgi:hypothetical protein
MSSVGPIAVPAPAAPSAERVKDSPRRISVARLCKSSANADGPRASGATVGATGDAAANGDVGGRGSLATALATEMDMRPFLSESAEDGARLRRK